MKPSHSLFLLLALGAATVPAVQASPSTKVLLARTDAAKVKQAEDGTIKEARASWWGFNKDDATESLQKAISSGVSRLIVDNTGSDWIISEPITLVSNQEIIFQNGVIIQAKKGAFKGKNDSLFTAKNLSNITLIGEGQAKLRMQRADYDNPELYAKSEWRHGIGLWDCENVTIRNLTVEETGGDGLYLGASSTGYNKNILVEDCIFDNNYRQGISVISAEDFIVRRCQLTNTQGTNPQAGIDYEPNHPGQRIVNCLIEDTKMVGNKGPGLVVYTVNLNRDSLPVSVTVNRCTFANNSSGIVSTVTRSAENPVVAEITVSESTFDHDTLRLRNSFVGSATHLFRNVRIDLTPAPGIEVPAWRGTPIVMTADRGLESQSVGGVHFENVTVKAAEHHFPLAVRFQGQGKLSNDITGNLLWERAGKTTAFDLQGFIKKEQEYHSKINALKPAIARLDHLQPPAAIHGTPTENNFYTRDKFTFLQYAKKGDQITISATARKVYAQETEVELHSPSGKKLGTYIIPYNNTSTPITFTAEETGLYRLTRTQKFSQRMQISSENPGNGFLIENSMDFLPQNGKLYFEVPAGVKEFNIGVSTDSTANVALVDPRGETVQKVKEVGRLHLFSGTRPDASLSEVWSLDVSDAVWSVVVHFYGDLSPVVSTNPATLLRVQK